MLMRASVGCTLRNWRSTPDCSWNRFAIERGHACSVRGCPASWSPPSGGAESAAGPHSGTGAISTNYLALRIALAVIDVFLQLNGRELTAEEVDAAETIQSVAAGKLTEDELAAWINEHSRAI